MDSSTTSSDGFFSPSRTSYENETLRGAKVPSPSGSSPLVGPIGSSLAQQLAVDIPPCSVLVTSRDVCPGHPRYPAIGQFAMTASEEVVAAGPDGLFSFKRVNDHPSKPWCKHRPFPGTPLNSSSVSGIALRESESGDRLDVFCVADGKLHTFSRTNERHAKAPPPSFVADSSPPLATYRVSGTPSITTIKEASYGSFGERYGLVVPSRSGGLLHTSTTGPSSYWYSSGQTNAEWESVNHVAKHLGIISAITTATLKRGNLQVDIVAVCIVQGRLHSVEGPFTEPKYGIFSFTPGGWKDEKTDRIPHPGEVTGNPALLQKKLQEGQLDLLVPSAAGGIFHFVQTPSTPDEWHMIGRIDTPSYLPPAGSLGFFHLKLKDYFEESKLRAAGEIGGRLYTIETSTLSSYSWPWPWRGCYLHPVIGPGAVA
uniref:Uncharacterized protein n=1 Tax=Bionectria ochroleuca TaxID=29856 RepID=A0A8H7TUP9_BIOOC